MGYREKAPAPKPVRRVMQTAATHNMTFIQNGTTAYLAIPCWYLEVKHPQHTHVHDREWHDHIGWPEPDHVDMSCQDAHHVRGLPFRHTLPFHYFDDMCGWVDAKRYLDLSKTFPIHLEDEGYTSVDIAFDLKPDGLTASGEIDDHIVRLTISPVCADAIAKDVDVPYAVFLNGTIGSRAARDMIARGVIRILGGPIYS